MLYCVNLLNIKEKALKETSFAGSTSIDRNGLSPTESRPVVCVQGEEHSRAHDRKSICFRRISRLPEDCAWRALSVKVGEQRRFSTRVVPREMRSFLLLKAGYGFLVPEFMSVADIGSGTFLFYRTPGRCSFRPRFLQWLLLLMRREKGYENGGHGHGICDRNQAEGHGGNQ